MCQALCGRDARAPGGGIIHTKNREHGLHHAQESGKELGSALKNHSPLEGESARGRSPQSSRRGANAASRAEPAVEPEGGERGVPGGARSRAGGGRTPRLVSEFQRCVGGPYAASFLKRCAFPKGASNSPPTRLPGDRIFYDNSAREVGLRVERRQSFLMFGTAFSRRPFTFGSIRYLP